MIFVCFLKLHVFDTVFTNPQLWLFSILLRKRWKIPGIYLIFSKLNFVHKLDFSNLKKETQRDYITDNDMQLCKNFHYFVNTICRNTAFSEQHINRHWVFRNNKFILFKCKIFYRQPHKFTVQESRICIFLLAHSPKLMWVEIFLSDNNNFIYSISWTVAWELSLIIYCCESACHMPFIICKQTTNQTNHTIYM